MEKENEDILNYINQAEPFAQPILKYWFSQVLKVCPGVKATIKYSIPHFDFNNDYMCAMAAYSKHCSFTFFKAPLMSDPRLKESKSLKPVQRFLGKISSIQELPPEEEFSSLLLEAMALNEQGVKIKRTKTSAEKPIVLEIPPYFLDRLIENVKAKEIFESKSNSFRKEYVQWITEAKTEATRLKRLNDAIQWISEGKSRFWQSKK